MCWVSFLFWVWRESGGGQTGLVKVAQRRLSPISSAAHISSSKITDKFIQVHTAMVAFTVLLEVQVSNSWCKSTSFSRFQSGQHYASNCQVCYDHTEFSFTLQFLSSTVQSVLRVYDQPWGWGGFPWVADTTRHMPHRARTTYRQYLTAGDF